MLCTNGVSDLFLVTVVDEMVLGSVRCPAKYIALPFYPVEWQTVKDVRGDSPPYIPSSFIPKGGRQKGKQGMKGKRETEPER